MNLFTFTKKQSMHMTTGDTGGPIKCDPPMNRF